MDGLYGVKLTNMNNKRLCIFGEVLFDQFPDGKHVLGGAPFNVAWHLQALAQSPYFISRVGNDPEGESIRASMRDWGMDVGGLQTDPKLPTGHVNISLTKGEPTYDIVEHCAYDAIETVSEQIDCHLFYHGSLALREAISRSTAEQLKTSRPGTVFVDVNLRSPWWQREEVQEMLRGADWVKLNTDELEQLTVSGTATDVQASHFVTEYDLKGLILTHGSRGAEIVTASSERFEVQPQRDIEVIDTVGAGDAFASIIILGLVNDWPLALTLQRAQIFASKLVGHRGATVTDPAFYQSFFDAWKLNA
jgi:fructokinase